MEIRPAKPDDVPAVLPMVAKIAALHEQWDAAKFGYKPHPEQMYHGWLTARSTDPRSVFLVADHPAAQSTDPIAQNPDKRTKGRTKGGHFPLCPTDKRGSDPLLSGNASCGSLVGFLIGTVDIEIPIYRLTEYGFIHDVWVEPEYRNEGIGRQLVMLAIEKFRDLGMTQVRGDTAAANEPARNLLKSCGMRPSTTEMLIEIPAEQP